jgi:hypothetical protein
MNLCATGAIGAIDAFARFLSLIGKAANVPERLLTHHGCGVL